MKNYLKAALAALAAALFSVAALADGVPLITPGPALSSKDPARQLMQQKRSIVKLHPIVLNRNAFGANVVTVMIDGKEHRFVGAMQDTGNKGILAWGGTEGAKTDNVYLLSLTKIVATGELLGYINTAGKAYQIATVGGRSLLIEEDPNLQAGTRPYMPASAASQGGR